MCTRSRTRTSAQGNGVCFCKRARQPRKASKSIGFSKEPAAPSSLQYLWVSAAGSPLTRKTGTGCVLLQVLKVRHRSMPDILGIRKYFQKDGVRFVFHRQSQGLFGIAGVNDFVTVGQIQPHQAAHGVIIIHNQESFHVFANFPIAGLLLGFVASTASSASGALRLACI